MQRQALQLDSGTETNTHTLTQRADAITQAGEMRGDTLLEK